FSDTDGDTLANVKIVNLETVGSLQLSGIDVALKQKISRADIDAGNLKYIPVANTNGSSYDSFEFKVGDGNNSSGAHYTMTVDVTAVNDAPTAANNTVTTTEDTTYTFSASDFSYSDIDSDTMASVKITTLEAAGSLQLSGFDVTLNQVITKADIDAGNLKFVPVGNANGSSYDSFAFSVNDGTADSASSYTMTVDVTAVNDVSTFSTGDGLVSTAISAGNEYVSQMAVQSDGKIVTVGYDSNDDVVLTRHNIDGTLDTSFDTDGIVFTNVSDFDFGYSIAIQSDGKILVSGLSQTSGNGNFLLLRYNSDGSLDTSFGSGNGIVTTDVSGYGEGYSVTTQADGKILVAGYSADGLTVARFNSDGTLDTSFDSDGIATATSGTGQEVLVQTDGSIVVTGYASGNFTVTRFDSSGSLDTSFDTDGIVTTDLGASDFSFSAALQSDGKIVVVGYSNNDV
ncbi:MAG: hypothetical protein GY770_31830, partial [Aestuariibacter sp.]|nr:hypothetical protein [Aestuariibacter sp.]